MKLQCAASITTRAGGALAAAALLAGCAHVPSSLGAADGPASLVLVNGDVRTVDPDQPHAEAFAVRDGRFVAVGAQADIEPLIGEDTTVIDAGGATVTPGLIDGHVHLTSGVNLVRGVNLYGIRERETWLEMIAERDAQLPEGQWILGGRWDHTLTNSPLPTKEELDAVVPDRPVFLNDVDGHSSWANSLALELAGVTADSVSPEGGVVMKDPETGEPTGILLERAGSLVTQSDAFAEGTQLSEEERLKAIADTHAFANSLGLTGAHDMADMDTFRDYARLLSDDALSLRLWYGVFSWDTDKDGYLAMKAEGDAAVAEADTDGPMLTLGYMKLVIDGVLSTHTAALLEPYTDRPDELGLPMMAAEDLNIHVADANAAGFPVAVHAIGDNGVRMALNAFAESPEKAALPNRVEHVEMLHPDDFDRFAEEGVIASMNPHHAVTTFHNYLLQRIGEHRAATAYAWRGVKDTGADMVLGSDWPTAPLSPFEQLWAAIFRVSAFGMIDEPWHPEQRLSFDDALHGYTQAAADAAGLGDEIGSITVGKQADFVIIDQTIPEPPTQDLRYAKPRATYLAGRAVFEATP